MIRQLYGGVDDLIWWPCQGGPAVSLRADAGPKAPPETAKPKPRQLGTSPLCGRAGLGCSAGRIQPAPSAALTLTSWRLLYFGLFFRVIFPALCTPISDPSASPEAKRESRWKCGRLNYSYRANAPGKFGRATLTGTSGRSIVLPPDCGCWRFVLARQRLLCWRLGAWTATAAPDPNLIRTAREVTPPRALFSRHCNHAVRLSRQITATTLRPEARRRQSASSLGPGKLNRKPRDPQRATQGQGRTMRRPAVISLSKPQPANSRL